jgi:ferritin
MNLFLESKMNIDLMLNLLNEDLSREYSHWNFYIHAATSVGGLHREEIGEFLLEQAQEEMKHIEEFKRVIYGIITRRRLDFDVSTNSAKFVDNLKDPELILKEAQRMEDQVVSNYIQRIEDANSLQQNGGQDKIDGKFIELFLEDQIMHSRMDADNIVMMLIRF